MKESLRELCKWLVCIWDEGCQDCIWIQREIPQSGIYMIRIGDDFYIGRSVNLKNRIMNHLSGILQRGNLGSSKARKQFEEIRQLSIYVICEAKPSELDEKEQYYIDTYKPTLNIQFRKREGKLRRLCADITEKNMDRLFCAKQRGLDGFDFSSKGEVIDAILDRYFEENGEPEGMEYFKRNY